MDDQMRILTFRHGESSAEPKHRMHLEGAFSRFGCGETDSSASGCCDHASRDVCDRGVLLALRVDEMLRFSAGLLFRSARGARFDDRLQFHSSVAQKTVGRFECIANPYWSRHPRGTPQGPD